jgi:hypothetical protein
MLEQMLRASSGLDVFGGDTIISARIPAHEETRSEIDYTPNSAFGAREFLVMWDGFRARFTMLMHIV